MLLYLFSALLLVAALKMVFSKNPAYAALYLALCMGLLAGVFFVMGEPFLAGLQLLIYAGAVMVLFVMVLMLFDFSTEPEDRTGDQTKNQTGDQTENQKTKAPSKDRRKFPETKFLNPRWQTLLSLFVPVFLFGLLSGLISLMAFSSLPALNPVAETGAKEGLGVIYLIFTKYALIFELLGLALLIIAIGVVALNRVERAAEGKPAEAKNLTGAKDLTGAKAEKRERSTENAI